MTSYINSKFYEVYYMYCGQTFKTTILADGVEKIKSILGNVEIKSIKVL